MFVEQVDDAPHHLPASVIAGRLGDGNDFDLVLGQLALIHAELDTIAEEARQTVDDDGLERGWFLQGIRDHLLENGALVVGGGCARLDVLLHH
ncbi:MAG: hypothetical protein K2P67_04250 [Gallionellaceae bacterium]|nr:hypothetical protein [Gallionellaceae bacterium]